MGLPPTLAVLIVDPRFMYDGEKPVTVNGRSTCVRRAVEILWPGPTTGTRTDDDDGGTP